MSLTYREEPNGIYVVSGITKDTFGLYKKLVSKTFDIKILSEQEELVSKGIECELVGKIGIESEILKTNKSKLWID